MAEINLPANLPTDFQWDDIIAPNGADIGKAIQYGYNYAMEQINATQEACNALSKNKVNGISVPGGTTIYVSKSGNDARGGLESPFLTLGKAFEFLKTLSPGGKDSRFRVQIDNGTYSEPGLFIGDLPTRLYIESVNANADLVKVVGTSSDVPALSMYNSTCSPHGITFESGNADGVVRFMYCNFFFDNCKVISTAIGKGIGLDVGVSIGRTGHSSFNNCSSTLKASYGAHIATYGNSGTGNDIALDSGGATIIASGTIPTATTNYTKSAGGIIFKDGVQV